MVVKIDQPIRSAQRIQPVFNQRQHQYWSCSVPQQKPTPLWKLRTSLWAILRKLSFVTKC